MIVSKRPEPGRVKTRLCPPLDPQQAANLAEGMLRDAVERCVACSQFRTKLAFAPATAAAWFRQHFPELQDQQAQVGTSFAERLHSVFTHSVTESENMTVVAIGSDQPLISTARITQAHEALEAGADVVLGPDIDGGYYLIGMRRAHERIFLGVEMSTDKVLDETLRVARRAGLEVSLLDEGYDIDVEGDLVRLNADLELLAGRSDAAVEFPRHTARRLAEVFPADG